MSWKAYSYRLYYDCQIASKLDIYNDKYWRLSKQIASITKKSCEGQRTFLGGLTKAAIAAVDSGGMNTYRTIFDHAANGFTIRN
jgi:hypothetical protein